MKLSETLCPPPHTLIVEPETEPEAETLRGFAQHREPLQAYIEHNASVTRCCLVIRKEHPQ